MRRFALLLVLALPRVAAADGEKLTLDQVIGKAIANPKVEMAQSDQAGAEARVDEADASRLPRIKGTAFGTISPEIDCIPNTNCTETSPRNFAFRFSGFFGTAEVDVTQPLYTFGKISHARAAARAGLDAQRALSDEAAGDAAVDAARAYWGLKLARELGAMLDDGIEEIDKATKDFDQKKDSTVQDRQRVAVLLAEAKTQRAEAAQGEADALAGLRAITADPKADIDDSDLAAKDYKLPDDKGVLDAAQRRPQRIAAQAGAKAADELAGFEASQYFPDIALVGSAVISHAQGVDDPPSAFAYDPYRRTGAGIGVGLQWTIEPWNTAARTAKARADAHRMHAQANLADIGANYDAQQALDDAKAAKAKLDATTAGEKSARTWLAAVLQDQAIGTAEARDLADAYIAWFQMRARWAAAVMQWNVAVVRLQRATGEFRAGPYRPR
jgi:outer membrane protein TolC